MFKNRLLRALLAPFFAFVGEEDGGGKVDRGDDFTPTEDSDGAAAAKALADKEAKDAADAAAAKAELDAADAKKEEEDAAKKAEDEAKAAGADDDKEDKEGKKKKGAIPLDRHESILKKERERVAALEAELAKTKQTEQKVESDKFLTEQEAKLEDLEEKYNKALVDGKLDDAKKLMRDLRATERAIGDHKADLKASAAQEQAVEAVRYDTVVERLEKEYPVLDSQSEDFDKAVVREVLELKAAYEVLGHKPSAALQKSVEKTLGVATRAQEKAVTTTPRVTESDAAKKLKEERTAEATAKAVAAAKATPPSTSKVGADSDKAGGTIDAKDVMKMNQRDFAKLSEDDLKRMRGDDL